MLRSKNYCGSLRIVAEFVNAAGPGRYFSAQPGLRDSPRRLE